MGLEGNSKRREVVWGDKAGGLWGPEGQKPQGLAEEWVFSLLSLREGMGLGAKGRVTQSECLWLH